MKNQENIMEMHLVLDSEGGLSTSIRGNKQVLIAALSSIMDEDQDFFDIVREAAAHTIMKRMTDEEKDEIEEILEGALPSSVWSQVVAEA
jgi:hypothetical protein